MWRVRASIKPLALKGDKTGPVIGIIPITEHLSEKKLAKISGQQESSNDSTKKDLQKQLAMYTGLIILWEFVKTQFSHLYRSVCLISRFSYCLSWRD